MSIRLRLALFGIFTVTLTLAAFSMAFFGLLSAAGTSGQDEELAKRADETLAAISGARAEELRPRSVFAPVDPSDAIDVFVVVLGPGGTPLYSTGAIEGQVPSVPADVLEKASRDGKAQTHIEPAPGVRLRVNVQPWSRPDLGTEGYVVAAQSAARIQRDRTFGIVFVAVAAILAFLVAAGAIWLVTGRALRPLRQLAALTDEVGRTQDLTQRLPVPAAHDDLRRLSDSFNEMMSRLDTAYRQLAEALESQKRFVADASHELRTPLTSIRSNAGFLLQHPDAQEDDRAAALQDIAGESERMSRMVQGLLTLARADAGYHLEKTPLDLGALLQDVSRQARNLHDTREIRTDAPAVTVSGNADALKQLLWILIDNAVRHTSDGGRLRLAVEVDDQAVRIIVADDGEGIPADHLQHIFDRFFQSDVSRSRGGAGLGLSIAHWIVQEHDGTISAHNNDHGGATLVVELPIAEGVAGQEPGAGEGAADAPTEEGSRASAQFGTIAGSP